jgi:membrane protease YdiL (CAAX protease family)
MMPPDTERPTRLDLLAVVAAMVFPTLATWLYFVVFAGSAAMPIVAGLCKVAQFGFPAIWVFGVRRQAFRLSRPAADGLGVGVGFGLLAVAALAVLYLSVFKSSELLAGVPRQIEAKLDDIGANTPLRFLALAVFYSALHSLLEEYYWRWFVFGGLRRWAGVATAVALSSLAFMAHHVIVIGTFLGSEQLWTATLPLSFAVAAGGAVWAILYHRTGSLYACWVSHALVDAGLLAVGYDLIGS